MTVLTYIPSNERYPSILAQIDHADQKISIPIIIEKVRVGKILRSYDALFVRVLCSAMNQQDRFSRISLQLHGE